MSIEEAKIVALERAKVQAISDEFGSIVSQSSTMIMSTQNGETDNQYLSYGGSEVKGEWIETIGSPKFIISFEDGYILITCEVKGFIKESRRADLDFDCRVLCNGTNLKYEQTTFKDGDDMYVFFQSPYDGYLSMFWIDYSSKNVYKIIPYQSFSQALMPIKRDETYILFSKSNASEEYRSIVDEFSITCSSSMERNELVAVFSDSRYSLSNIEGYDSGIKCIAIESFHRWLANLKKKTNDTIIKSYPITIIRR